MGSPDFSKPQPTDEPERRKQQRQELLATYVASLALALDVQVTTERNAIYVKTLEDLTAGQIHHAFHRALKEFRPEFGVTFPPPAQIREWAESFVPPQDETRKLLARPDKPPETTTIDGIEVPMPRGVSREEVQQWLDDGKQKQRDHIAKLEADPAWQAMAKRLGAFAGLNPKIETTTVPKDPEERKRWATKKAKEQGWAE